MSYRPNAAALDPREFIIAPPVAALDEFVMTGDDGSPLANINEAYIDRFVARMNQRENETGDLCPLVVGHTPPADKWVPETQQPPIVGFARNWFKSDWKNGKKAAFFTPWVYRDKVALAKSHPRRSCEIWVNRYEADPISLLGATTPCRDLGLMKLSRDGSFTYVSPGEPITMPDIIKPADAGVPPVDPKEGGDYKSLKGEIDQIKAMLTQLTQTLAPQAQPGAAPPGAPPGAAQPGGEMSDAELDQMLAQLDGQGGGAAPPPGDQSRKGDQPEKEGYGCPGGNTGNTQMTQDLAKMQKIEDENRDLKIRLSRLETQNQVAKLGTVPGIDAADEQFIQDLTILPPDIRARWLDRLTKLSARTTTRQDNGLSAAVQNAQPSPANTTGKKRLGDLPPDQANAEKSRLVKLAREKHGNDFAAAARADGYDL